MEIFCDITQGFSKLSGARRRAAIEGCALSGVGRSPDEPCPETRGFLRSALRARADRRPGGSSRSRAENLEFDVTVGL